MTFRVLRRAVGVWRAQGRRARTRVLTKPVSPRAKLSGLDERWKSSGSTAKGFSPRSAATLRAAPSVDRRAPHARALPNTPREARSACSTPHFLRDDDADASERPTPLGRAAPRGAARRRAPRRARRPRAPRRRDALLARASTPTPCFPPRRREASRGAATGTSLPPPAARDPRRRKQPYVPTRVPFERPSRVPPFPPPASSRSLTFAILLHPAQRPSRVALPPRPSPRASSPPLVVRARVFDFRRRTVRLPR